MSTPSRDRPPTFSTERLQLAIYLHASERLQFSHCAQAEVGKVSFVFADPEQTGADAELEFDRGASCPATDLFASQKFLRRKMSEALNHNRRIETTYAYTR